MITNETESTAADAATTTHAPEHLAHQVNEIQQRIRRWTNWHVYSSGIAGDLSLQQMAVLLLIRSEGLAPSELARRLLVSSTVITGIVDRLVQRGYVIREEHPSDRRRLRLLVTDAGNHISVEAQHIYEERIAEQLREMTTADHRALGQGLVVLERLFVDLEASVSPTVKPRDGAAAD